MKKSSSQIGPAPKTTLQDPSKHLHVSSFPRLQAEYKPMEMVNCLNALLANEYAVFTKTLNYHWNVTGPRFHSVHQFLEDHYFSLLKIVDNVAERIRKIGGYPKGTLIEFQSTTSVPERPGVHPETSEMIADLMSDHQSLQTQIKAILKEVESSKDPGTEDFLIGLLKSHEEMSWMLKSHLS